MAPRGGGGQCHGCWRLTGMEVTNTRNGGDQHPGTDVSGPGMVEIGIQAWRWPVPWIVEIPRNGDGRYQEWWRLAPKDGCIRTRNGSNWHLGKEVAGTMDCGRLVPKDENSQSQGCWRWTLQKDGCSQLHPQARGSHAGTACRQTDFRALGTSNVGGEPRAARCRCRWEIHPEAKGQRRAGLGGWACLESYTNSNQTFWLKEEGT